MHDPVIFKFKGAWRPILFITDRTLLKALMRGVMHE
jgi:hypothetical protein